MDLILVSGMDKVEKGSSQRYEKSVGDVTKALLDIINPYRQQQAEERRKQQKADVEREKFLGEVARSGSKGYGSLKAIKESLGKISRQVREMSKNDNS